jgi:hypothetical protein
MAVKQVVMYGVDIEDKPGSLHRFLSQSSLSGVDYLCFTAYSCGNNKGRVFVGAKAPKIFEAFAKEAKLKITPAAGFIISNKDRLGAAADIIKGLAENSIRGLAGTAIVCDGLYKMLVVVDAKDASPAEKVLSQK